MDGLYYCLEKNEHSTLYLIRFYNESNYVITKKITGSKIDYIKKELANFRMEGLSVKGAPEYTFCGAFDESPSSISFKVENEITDYSESWVNKDVITFKGKINPDGSIFCKQTHKRNGYSFDCTYTKTSDELLIEILLKQI